MSEENKKDELSLGLKIVSVIIPLVGAIIYFSNKSENPNKAKSACYASLIGVGLGIIYQVVVTAMA